MKNKTLAVWLAFLGGTFGLHRFYLRGFGDWLGWLLPLPTLAGAYGVLRMWSLGQNDALSWALVPVLGLTFAACCLTAIVYGLMTPERWNERFNPRADAQASAGQTRWATIWGIVGSLMIGTGVLMASIAIGFQGYFQYQVEEGRKISQ
ncbi:TM2 domain-containing protein [Ramlibacter tataouinensis]|uniref:TM2 domain-containing protein n=1 Tax=Ramlibacter tataouinensis TaxID=94132 RepID=UPI0022F3FDFE|nr:TM2 domain-containing protein [Ramlibacter tataouinensis]WBY01157.1 TM2 domain-containing protein [Ramlibacter tataouinensis]